MKSLAPSLYRADREMARKVILRLPVVRDAVDLALLPLALAGRVEE